MSLKPKRIRSINWDEEEKQLLRSVLKPFATTIENKSLDNNTNKYKTKAWEEVHKKFNELNGRLRSLNQIKIQWKMLKINARRQVGQFKKTVNKTGGGERPQTPVAAIEITDLLNPAELLQDENPYDSDGIMISASSSRLANISTNETCTITLQDITENVSHPDECETTHLGRQEVDSMSVITVGDDQIPAAVCKESSSSMILQDNAAEVDSKEVKTQKNIFKHIKNLKKSSKSSSCSSKIS